jgi:transposase
VQIAVTFKGFYLQVVGFHVSRVRPADHQHLRAARPASNEHDRPLRRRVIGPRSKTTDLQLATRHDARSLASAPTLDWNPVARARWAALQQRLQSRIGRRFGGCDHKRHERELADIVRSLDPTLLGEVGVGPISAAKLLVCDPARFKSEAAFARCNGTAPLPASSGKTVRHRLSRGGDRQVNNAIHTIALSRSLHQADTRAYLDRRITEGKNKREAMRSLKCHLSRHLFKRLVQVPLTS